MCLPLTTTPHHHHHHHCISTFNPRSSLPPRPLHPQVMMRLKNARNLDPRHAGLVDSAYFSVKPPSKEQLRRWDHHLVGVGAWRGRRGEGGVGKGGGGKKELVDK